MRLTMQSTMQCSVSVTESHAGVQGSRPTLALVQPAAETQSLCGVARVVQPHLNSPKQSAVGSIDKLTNIPSLQQKDNSFGQLSAHLRLQLGPKGKTQLKGEDSFAILQNQVSLQSLLHKSVTAMQRNTNSKRFEDYLKIFQ